MVRAALRGLRGRFELGLAGHRIIMREEFLPHTCVCVSCGTTRAARASQ